MKKLFALAFGMLLLGAGALAQTTSVTATVTDSDGTIWKNGTWSVDFVANPANPYGTYYFNGSIIPPSMIHQSGSIDSSGALSFIVDQNASITPVGSSWNLKVCPDAIAQCGIFNFTAIGASMDLSASLTTAIPAPRFHPVSGAYGYNDTEAILSLVPGSTYWNVSSSLQRCYSGSAWTVCNSGNGTNTPSPQFQVPYYLGPGTSAIIKGDSGITTDGLGNLAASSMKAKIQDNGGQVFDVKAYGAKGDGTTDDRAAIALAIAAATTSCGTVYFPAFNTFLIASNPNSGVANNAIFTRPPCVSIDGAGTIKMGSGLTWDNLFQTNNETGATIQNVTIDVNGPGNPINAAWGNTNSHNLINVQNGDNLTVKNVTFLNMNGVYSVSANAVNDVSIVDNKWINLGSGGTYKGGDTSEIYANGDRKVISGNSFIGTGPLVNTAIEIHGSHSTVTSNVAQKVGACVVYSVDTATGGTGADNVIANNSCYASNSGIQFWSTDGNIDGLTIKGNTITIDRNLANSSTGPGFTPAGSESCISWQPGSTHPITNVKIDGNKCEFTTETAVYAETNLLSGISIDNETAGTAQTVNNLSITDNHIYNSPAMGIGLGWGSATFTNVLVQGNQILNPGEETDAGNNWRDGLYVAVGTVAIGPNFVVARNQITDNQTIATVQHPIAWYGHAADNAPVNARSVDNIISYKTTPAAPTSFYDTSAPFIHENFYGFGANISTVFTGAYASGQYPPFGSTVYDPSNGYTYTNEASNNSGSVTAVGWMTGSTSQQLQLVNPTQATSGANQSPPNLYQIGYYWNGTVSTEGFFSQAFNFGTGTNPSATLIDNIPSYGNGAFYRWQIGGSTALEVDNNHTLYLGTTPILPGSLIGYAGYAGGNVQLSENCTTGSIGGSALAAGASATGTCTVTGTLTGHTGVAVASDGSVQGNYIPQVSVSGSTVTVTLTAVTAGTPAAKTYLVSVF